MSWQCDNALVNHYSNAQLYFEELTYLRSIGKHENANWIYDNLDETLRMQVDEFANYVGCDISSSAHSLTLEEENVDEASKDSDESATNESESQQDEKSEKEFGKSRLTSFMFMRLIANGMKDEDKDQEEPSDDEESCDSLYNPNKMPRFWKRYLRGQHLDDGEEDDVSEAKTDVSDESESGESDSSEEEEEQTIPNPNSPFEDYSSEETGDASDNESEATEETENAVSDEASEENSEEEDAEYQFSEMEEAELSKKERRHLEREEKKRQKEEKKRLKEEEKRQKRERKKKKSSEDDEAQTDVTTEVIDDDNNDEAAGKDGEKGESKEEKSRKKKKEKKSRLGKMTPGEKILPHEDDEETNPKIRIYNDIVRAAYNYSEEPISYEGVSPEDLRRIVFYVLGDYPELFWIRWYGWAGINKFVLKYRCMTPYGKLDVKQIESKRKEIKKGAKYFTKGIAAKTDPYQALLTIYRRLVLSLDYDSVGLQAKVDEDQTRDDSLRSLYNAIVKRNVVCAGYAVAAQYLLQSVGIVCGYVISETNSHGSCHAYNILKIGKYCYYLDCTWGDYSNTDKNVSRMEDIVFYNYVCTPFREFLRTAEESKTDHSPDKEIYPNFEEFNYSNHEYYRYHKAYLTNYNEDELVRIFADTAIAYDEKEMGRFAISFRCSDVALAKHVYELIRTNGKLFDIYAKAHSIVAKKNKKAAKLLDVISSSSLIHEDAGIIYLFPEHKDKK